MFSNIVPTAFHRFSFRPFCALIAAIFPAASFAASNGTQLSPGVYDESTGSTLQAICLEWSSNQETCNKLQFSVTTNDKVDIISSIIDNNNAPQLTVPGSAPVSAPAGGDDSIAITKKAWSDHLGAMIGVTTGLLGAGLTLGSVTGYKIPGRPKISESQNLSENLPNPNGYIYGITIVNEDIPYVNSLNLRVWTTFFDSASSYSPEARVQLFVRLMNYASSTDPNLLQAFGLWGNGTNLTTPPNMTLVRIEYQPNYKNSPNAIQNSGASGNYQNYTVKNSSYNFVFVPNDEIAQYQQYITNTQQANARALKWWRQDQAFYYSAVIGGTILVALTPLIVDGLRDLNNVVSRKSVIGKNRRIIKEWTDAWGAIFNKGQTQAIPVHDKIYDAMVKEIRLKFAK